MRKCNKRRSINKILDDSYQVLLYEKVNWASLGDIKSNKSFFFSLESCTKHSNPKNRSVLHGSSNILWVPLKTYRQKSLSIKTTKKEPTLESEFLAVYYVEQCTTSSGIAFVWHFDWGVKNVLFANNWLFQEHFHPSFSWSWILKMRSIPLSMKRSWRPYCHYLERWKSLAVHLANCRPQVSLKHVVK